MAAIDGCGEVFAAPPDRGARCRHRGRGDHSSPVKRSLLAVVGVAVVLLLGGLVCGLRPISAPITLVSPELREVSVTCGIGYLPGVPSGPGTEGPGDTVRLASDPSVALPRAAYAEHCAEATGVWPYAAWGLTGLGVVGLSVLFAGRGSRVGSTS
jgi:hypothetical protein